LDTPAAPPWFILTGVTHRFLGRLVRLELPPRIRLDLTPAEAFTLSLALAAVCDGRSEEKEIYLSPIASDASFVGTVTEGGMAITAAHDGVTLDWAQVVQLAETLAEASIA
jgi:hypothetical protein